MKEEQLMEVYKVILSEVTPERIEMFDALRKMARKTEPSEVEKTIDALCKVANEAIITNNPVKGSNSNKAKAHLPKSERLKYAPKNKRAWVLNDKQRAEIKWLASNTRIKQDKIAAFYGVDGCTVSYYKVGRRSTLLKSKKPSPEVLAALGIGGSDAV